MISVAWELLGHTVMILRTIAMAAAVFTLTGCGPQMMDGSDHMQIEIAAARSENATHRKRTESATSLDEALSELVRHDHAMGGTAQAMRHALDDMSHCSNGTAQMHAKTKEMGAMTQAHGDRMRAAKELREAQDEVRAHHGDMLDLLASMESTMSDMSCPMMNWH